MEWAFVPPVIIDDIAKDEAALDLVASKLKYVFFTGGGIPQLTGNIFNSKVPIFQNMGQSESAMFPLLRPTANYAPEDWSYIQLNPICQGEFRHRFDDLHELVIVRRPEYEKYQPIFDLFPELQEYETRDLFAPHPTKPGLWQHRSRIDDVIVFLNGEKTNPISFEQEVTHHPEVRGALVVGQQQFEAALLVELVDEKELDAQEQLQVIERLWPVISSANKKTPAHARISKVKIIFTDPARPMLRAGKGTIQRQGTVNLYSKEIARLYASMGALTSLPAKVTPVRMTDQNAVIRIVTELVKETTEWAKVNPIDDFFALGLDSLQVLNIVRELKLRFPFEALVPGVVYANPSVELLAKEIIRFSNQVEMPLASNDKPNNTLTSIREKYEAFIDGFARGIRSRSQPEVRDPTAPKTIILTGSTGALGSFILQSLISDPSVAHVYCFNRSADSKTMQISRNTERQLSTDFPESRVTFLAPDLSDPEFGLEAPIYYELLSSVTHIIHNAWPVDFNRALQSFQPSLDGVKGFICFAALAKKSPAVLFISSISSATSYFQTKGAGPLIPEAIIEDESSPAAMGYGQSKYLAERMLDYAADKLNIITGSVRVGQIAGTDVNPRGWNRNEWLPSLVLSSHHIGAVPESLGTTSKSCPAGIMGDIAWVPINQVASIVVDLTFALSQQASNSGTRVFHAVNPHTITWQELLPTVKESLEKSSSGGSAGENKGIQVLPFHEWVARLGESSKLANGDVKTEVESDLVYRNPGIKLLSFYESLLEQVEEGTAKFDTKKTSETSQSMQGLKPIKPEWMTSWIENWISK
ncbi:hypothetical protein ABW20_dc0107465 [Dactylellina cionopaga]|nr:hypothetical protein ABW20_dc0107465 [Dactylellina cionopaga]